jgi:Spy/CpxP family protein refolding chaperone
MHTCHPFWRHAKRAFAACGPGPGGHFWGGPEEEMDEGFGGGAFGVRRPLRFLAHKLGLDERQIAELAKILDDLKTERAQAEVDRRRTTAALADALGADAFEEAKAKEAGDLRVQSAGRLREAVLTALRRLHAALNAEQRVRLAYLIRSGVLAV